MSNPFAVVFFGALFPQFIDPTQPVFPQLTILGTTYLFIDGTILIIWGWMGARAASLLQRHPSYLINMLCGWLMVAAVALLAAKDLQPQR